MQPSPQKNVAENHRASREITCLSVHSTELIGERSTLAKRGHAPLVKPGQVVNRQFRLVEQVGEGSMGVVWRADDPHGFPVCVKFLSKSSGPPTLEARRAEQIVGWMRGLPHEHICPLYSVGMDPELGTFLVMKYVAGITLEQFAQQRIADRKSFPVAEIVRILEPVAQGLDHLHRSGFVHGDIKPTNILIREDGSSPQIIDLGLVTSVRDHAEARSANVAGTLAYLAPELWRGAFPDSRCDQYALATIVYQLLGNRRPFDDAANTSMLMRQALLMPIPQLKQCSPSINAVLIRALAKSPEDRFRSCSEFLAALFMADHVEISR